MIRYEEWINRAKNSLALSKAYTIAGTCYEDLCFQVQQAAEKALKGLLIYHGVEPEFTHNIEILITELKKFTDIPENVSKAAKLTDYATFTRYPGEYDEVTKEEYEQAVHIAQDCLDWAENKIKAAQL